MDFESFEKYLSKFVPIVSRVARGVENEQTDLGWVQSELILEEVQAHPHEVLFCFLCEELGHSLRLHVLLAELLGLFIFIFLFDFLCLYAFELPGCWVNQSLWIFLVLNSVADPFVNFF